jgi:glycosyltransferase involved in cell wall biosynthesis
MKLSLVITLFNEEENVEPLLSKVYQALEGIDYEVLLIDDGSKDKTVERVLKFASDRVKLIKFNKNYGQTPAMAAGIEHAQGEYIVTMDGDLQNDPDDIPMMLKKIEESGLDMIAGNRKNRKDGMFLRKIPSKIANKIIRKTTEVRIKDYGCSLKIMKAELAKNIGLYGELHRFIPVLVALEGGKMGQVDVKHHPRIHGESKYGIGRTFRVVSDLILMLFFKRYLQKPMHLFAPPGIILFLLGGGIEFYLLILKVLGNDIADRPLLQLGILLLLAGIQLLTFGIILELIQRTNLESQNKKAYRIKEIFVGKEKA